MSQMIYSKCDLQSDFWCLLSPEPVETVSVCFTVSASIITVAVTEPKCFSMPACALHFRPVAQGQAAYDLDDICPLS